MGEGDFPKLPLPSKGSRHAGVLTASPALQDLDARASVKSICDSRSGLSYRLGRRRNTTSGGVVHGGDGGDG